MNTEFKQPISVGPTIGIVIFMALVFLANTVLSVGAAQPKIVIPQRTATNMPTASPSPIAVTVTQPAQVAPVVVAVLATTTPSPIPATATAITQPTATVDVAHYATLEAVKLDNEERRIALERIERNSRDDSMWEGLKILAAYLVLFVLFCATLTFTASKWTQIVAAFRMPQQSAPQATEKRQEAMQTPEREEVPPVVRDWLNEFSGAKTLSASYWDGSEHAKKYGQRQTRLILEWLEKMGYVSKDASGKREWTESGIHWLERNEYAE